MSLLLSNCSFGRSFVRSFVRSYRRSLARQLSEIITSGHCERRFLLSAAFRRYDDDHLFICIVEDGICFLCLADAVSEKRLIFGFLDDIRALFMRDFREQAQTAHTFGLNAAFAPSLEQRMDFFNKQRGKALHGVDIIGEAQKKQLETVEQLEDTIQLALERENMIETLVDKTEQLDQEALKFRRSAKKLKNKLCCKRAKKYICIIFFVVFIAYGVMVAFCGGVDLSCLHESNDDADTDDDSGNGNGNDD